MYNGSTPPPQPANLHYADVNLHFWLNCRVLPTASHTTPSIVSQGYAVSEVIPTPSGNVSVDPCVGGAPPYQQWPTDDPGYEGYNYYTYGLVPMMDADSSKTFIHYVADPANAGAIGGDGSVTSWYRQPIDNMLAWARRDGRQLRVAFLFEAYRPESGTALGRLAAELSPAYPGNFGVIFSFQETSAIWDYAGTMANFKAACPAASRPDWVMMYSWKTITDGQIPIFHTDIQSWH